MQIFKLTKTDNYSSNTTYCRQINLTKPRIGSLKKIEMETLILHEVMQFFLSFTTLQWNFTQSIGP